MTQKMSVVAAIMLMMVLPSLSMAAPQPYADFSISYVGIGYCILSADGYQIATFGQATRDGKMMHWVKVKDNSGHTLRADGTIAVLYDPQTNQYSWSWVKGGYKVVKSQEPHEPNPNKSEGGPNSNK